MTNDPLTLKIAGVMLTEAFMDPDQRMELAGKIAKALTPREQSDDLERVARALVTVLGYPADCEWERIWAGNILDTPETGSLAALCRKLAASAIGAMRVGGGEDIRETLRQRALWVFQTYARCLVEHLPSEEQKYISVVEEFDKNIREAFWADNVCPVDEGK